jgi:hypothetical protein
MCQSENDDRGTPQATAPEARRAFLAKVGGAALAVPPVTSLILGATTKPANAKSHYGGAKKGKKGKKHGRGHGPH